MALDVWILPEGEQPGAKPGELITHLRRDGYYQFLHDFWPSSSSNGKIIDLYDDAVYRGANLPQLRGSLVRVREAALKREPRWEVLIGEQLNPKKQKFYSTVEKSKLLVLIDQLIAITDRAVVEGKEIFFFGD